MSFSAFRTFSLHCDTREFTCATMNVIRNPGGKGILIKPPVVQPDFTVLSTAVFNLNFVERKFLEIGCTWSDNAYTPVALFVNPKSHLSMSHTDLERLMRIVDELLAFMSDDGCHQTVIAHTHFGIKKVRCFSKTYVTISMLEGDKGRVSFTVRDLEQLRDLKECISRTVNEKLTVSELMTAQSTTLCSAVKNEIISDYLALPESFICSVIKNWSVDALPAVNPSFYKEIANFDCKRIVSQVWDGYIQHFQNHLQQQLSFEGQDDDDGGRQMNFEVDNGEHDVRDIDEAAQHVPESDVDEMLAFFGFNLPTK